MILLVDADNTLWDTHGVYLAVHEAMAQEVSSLLGFPFTSSDLREVRKADARLSALFGTFEYDQKHLVRAFALWKLHGLCSEALTLGALESACGTVDESLVTAGASILMRLDSQLPSLLPGARELLVGVRHSPHVIVAVTTEAPSLRTWRHLASHGLSSMVDHVFSYPKHNADSLSHLIEFLMQLYPHDLRVMSRSPDYIDVYRKSMLQLYFVNFAFVKSIAKITPLFTCLRLISYTVYGNAKNAEA